MRLIASLLLICSALFGGQAFTTPAATSITWPVDFPSLQNAYVEIGVDIVGNCSTAFGVNNTANFVNVTLGNAATHRFGVGCNAVGTKAIHVAADNGTTPVQVVSDANMTGITTAVFRHTRDYDNNQKVFEAFRPDGTLIGTVSYLPGNSKGSTQICTTAPCTIPVSRAFLLPNGMVSIRWIRAYTGKPSQYGVLVPKDSFAAVGDLFNFEFEGTLADTSPRALALSNPATSCPGRVLAGCFTPNNTPAGTVVQASASSGSAGGTITLDASQSFRWDDTAPSTYTWQWISGPARPIIKTPRAGSTTVTRLVEGKHVFSYSVDGTAPATLSVTVPSKDRDGMPLYPSNVLTGSTSLTFRLADVPNAVDVRVTVRKPNGALLTPVIATSSPVSIPIDNRQKNHSYMLEYRDSNGKVLVSSDWQEAPVTQVEPAAIYASGGYNQIGGYLAISPGGNPAISKFLGKRYKYSVTDDRYMPPFKPTANPPIALWYIDSRGVYPYDMPKIKRCADDHSFNFEQMFLHMDADYAMDDQPSFSWTRSDMFDVTERNPNDGNQFWNGVIGLNPSTKAMVDYTLHAYSSTSRPTTCGSVTYCAAGDVVMNSSIRTLMFGYLEAFDRIVIDVQQSRSGGTVSWEYSTDGTTWSPLTVTDGTNGLTIDGTVTFTPPVNWKRHLHLATPNPNAIAKYFVKVTLSADTATFPTLNRITGDDWNIWEEEITTSGTGSAYTATSIRSPYVHGRRFKVFPHASTTGAATIAMNGGTPKKLLRPELSYTGVYSLPNGSFAANASSYIEYDSTLDGGKGAFLVLFKNRGWCDTDTAGNDRITGADGWEYDPTPGPTCSARFKYQSRQQFGWAADHTVSNLGDIQNGVRTRAQCILDFSDGILVRSDGTQQYNGIFLDDLSPDQPGMTGIVYPVLGSLGPNSSGDAAPNVKPIAYTELGNLTKIQELDLMADFVSDMRVMLKKKHPTFLLGGNAYTRNISKKWDLSLHEWGLYSLTARNWRYSPFASVYGIYSNPAMPDTAIWSQPDAALGGVSNATGEGYDWYSGGVGGNGINDFGDPIHSLHAFWDSVSYVPQPGGCTINVNCTSMYAWERGNRGPMNAYTQYLLGATAYTSFLYILGNQAQYYQNDAYRYVKTTPEFALTAPLSAAVTDKTIKTLSADFTNLPSTGGQVRIGSQYLTLAKVNNSTATTLSPVGQTFAIGTPIYLVHTDRLSENPPPPLAQIMSWDYFPAQDIDVGVPDTTNGIMGDTVNGVAAKGNRKLAWKTAGKIGASAGGVTNAIARRDFTKAIVLQASGNNAATTAELDTYSNNLVIQDFAGKTLNVWVLTADGKTPGGLCGPGITMNEDGSCPSVKIRNAEGVILMKQPVR